jgi:hypothetical protein
MKLSLVNLVAILMIAFYATGQTSVNVNGKGYHGYTFDSSHFVFASIKDQHSRYTPSTADIEEAEYVLRKKLKLAKWPELNRVDDCPIIHEKLGKYCRQYVGFINAAGHKVVWISFLWDKHVHESVSRDIISVRDGCSYYWNVEINIDTEELDNLQVNGIA